MRQPADMRIDQPAPRGTCAASNLPRGRSARRSAWQAQAARECGLSEAAKERLRELIDQINPLAKMVAKAKRRRCVNAADQEVGATPNLSREAVRPAAADIESESPVETDSPSQSRRHRDARDIRVPPVGSMIRRPYKGRDLMVHVVEGGFELDGRRYRSLSAIAREVTGAHWNGLLFFGLIHQEK